METINAGFHIINFLIRGDVVLAPMAGISDMPYRLLTRDMGNALSWTAFVNSTEVIGGHPHRLDDRLKYSDVEKPVVFQLYGNDNPTILKAAILLQDRKPDILDINLGCSVKAISARGAGAGMLRDMQNVFSLISTLTKELPIPVTTKIRLGWDETTKNHVEIAQMLEDAGSSLITVHARTRSQHFQHEADWHAIAEVKQAVQVPVIGNGDVKTVQDIDSMLNHTGCDAVMIGRAAIGNPWIFSRLPAVDISNSAKLESMQKHFTLMDDFYGESKAVLLFRKHAAGYLHHFAINRDERAVILKSTTKADLFSNMNRILTVK